MKKYIKSIVCISPQDTFLKGLPNKVQKYDTMLQTILPDFFDYFDPIDLRRMNKVHRAGSVCAVEALKAAKLQKSDAIILGSGLGSVMDTERFLNNMITNNETLLTPTAFINSTHNTLTSQIALTTKCQGYNMVYVHKTISFELALADAILTIDENGSGNILVGGGDELTQQNYELKEHIDAWKKPPCTNDDVINSITPGSVPGEGFAFSVISDDATDALAELIDASYLYFPDHMGQLTEFAKDIFERNNMTFDDVDVVLCGINGDKENDQLYFDFLESNFPKSTLAYYKNLCGEYDTASSFALWMATQIFSSEKVPEYAIISDKKREAKNILIYNHDNNKNHSFILVQKSKA